MPRRLKKPVNKKGPKLKKKIMRTPTKAKKPERPKLKIKKKEKPTTFSTDFPVKGIDPFVLHERIQQSFKKTGKDFLATHGTMDDSSSSKQASWRSTNTIPAAQTWWYASQGFIGYQLCAILAQQWLINKACTQPAKDAIRKGYEISSNNGKKIEPAIADAIRELDTHKYKLMPNLLQFIRMNRIFGIRIAMFKVEVSDPDKYYYKPFNIDGIKPYSYKGIVQIDPYWISPELDGNDAADPLSLNFYEPTWWRVGSLRIHRSHLIISRGDEVADILKPSYLYGGLSIPQKIYERVYAAERTANEAPLLALTKRLNVLKTDLSQVLSNQGQFEQRLQQMTALRDNHGTRVIGEGEEVIQVDTTLADLDAVIMSQFQLVSSASNVPATKLLGTTPKGFNATGEHEEASYHEELESIQAHDATPFLDRHYALLIKSEIAPTFSIEPFFVTLQWNPLDAMTEKEQAEVNEIKSRTDTNLVTAGAVDGIDIRNRIITDSASGYNGLSEVLESEELDDETESEADAPEITE